LTQSPGAIEHERSEPEGPCTRKCAVIPLSPP
jgi:hypothetical protein